MTYGNFYFGKNGFLYKKNQNIGARWNPPLGLICNQPQNIHNKYVHGSGIGSSSIFSRRAKLIHSTPHCVHTKLGLFSKYSSGSNNYPLNWNIK